MENDELEQILARIAQREGAKNDAQVAAALGVSRSSLPTWRSRDSIPYRALFEYANSRGVSLDWLFTGASSLVGDGKRPKYQVNEGAEGFDNRTERLRQVSQQVIAIAERQPEPMDAMRLGPVRDLAYRAGLNEEEVRSVFDLLRRSRRGEFWMDGTVQGVDVDLLVQVIRAIEDADPPEMSAERRARLYAEVYAHWVSQRASAKTVDPPSRVNVLPFVRRG